MLDLPELIPVISGSGLAGARAKAGKAEDLFHRGRDEAGQQGQRDLWGKKLSVYSTQC